MARRLLLAISLAVLTAAAAEPRPNILIGFADDWGRYASAYAALDRVPGINSVVRTPTIDRLAREGVLFRNAFVPSPSCTPCRSALLSGRHFYRTGRGAFLHGEWDSSIPAFPLLLRDHGYHLGKFHKVWGPGREPDAPFGGQAHAYERAGRDISNFSEVVSNAVARGEPLAVARARVLGQVRENFRAFLRDRRPGQPFLYWFGPTLTHRAWRKGSGDALWGIRPDSLRGLLPPGQPDVPEVRADFADYLGEIQAWDAALGVLVEELAVLGELDRTLIVLSGDHGMPGVPDGKCNLLDMGTGVALVARGPGVPPGRVVDDLVSLHDLAPTFIDAAGAPQPEGIDGRSLMPLLRSAQSGQVDPARTWVVTGRERHARTAREGNLAYPQRALRTREFLYIRNFAPDRWPMGDPRHTSASDLPSARRLESDTYAAHADMDASPTKAWLLGRTGDPQWAWHLERAFGKRPAEELYDLAKDPGQLRNVATDPAYAAVLRELGGRLLAHLRETGDPRVVGDGKAYDRPPFTDIRR